MSCDINRYSTVYIIHLVLPEILRVREQSIREVIYDKELISSGARI